MGNLAVFGFIVTCQGKIIGSSANIVAVKENIKNRELWNIQYMVYDSLQDEMNLGDSSYLGMNGAEILDGKQGTISVGWPFNMLLDSYTQDLMVIIPDQMGTRTSYLVGTVQVKAKLIVGQNGFPFYDFTVQ